MLKIYFGSLNQKAACIKNAGDSPCRLGVCPEETESKLRDAISYVIFFDVSMACFQNTKQEITFCAWDPLVPEICLILARTIWPSISTNSLSCRMWAFVAFAILS